MGEDEVKIEGFLLLLVEWREEELERRDKRKRNKKEKEKKQRKKNIRERGGEDIRTKKER